MLHAWCKGKVTVPAIEDCLTASVFCRLTYLSDDALVAILKRATRSSRFDDAAELREVQFWPRWRLLTRQKEPDVRLRFRNLDVIVESKRWDGVEQQNAPQLKDEWLAYEADPLIERERSAILLAVGGLGEVPLNAGEVPVVTCRWEDLARSVHDQPDINGFLRQDLLRVFDEFNVSYWTPKPLMDLAEFTQRWTIRASAQQVLQVDRVSEDNLFSFDIPRKYWRVDMASRVEMKDALANVSNAHLLLKAFNRRVLDLMKVVAARYAHKFYYWAPGGNWKSLLNSSCPWEVPEPMMLPLCSAEVLSLPANADSNRPRAGEWMLRQQIVCTDTGAVTLELTAYAPMEDMEANWHGKLYWGAKVPTGRQACTLDGDSKMKVAVCRFDLDEFFNADAQEAVLRQFDEYLTQQGFDLPANSLDA